jgi:hypothetical protein
MFVEVHVTINNTTILSLAQKCSYDEYLSPLTMKGSWVFMSSARYLCSHLSKFSVS